MSAETPSQSSASPSKRRAPSPPEASPDTPDLIEPKKSKIDPTLQPDPPIQPPSISLRDVSPWQSDANRMHPPPPPSPSSSLAARPGTSRLTPQHLETALQVLRNNNRRHPPRPYSTQSPSPDFGRGLGLPTRANAREAVRFSAATHLRRARNQLNEEMRIQGLKRSIVPVDDPSTDDLTTEPPSSPRPAPALLPSPDLQEKNDVKKQRQDEKEEVGFGFDFAKYGRAKRDGNGEGPSSKEEVEQLDGAGMASAVAQTGDAAWKIWAERLKGEAEKARAETEKMREEMKMAKEETERAWREVAKGDLKASSSGKEEKEGLIEEKAVGEEELDTAGGTGGNGDTENGEGAAGHGKGKEKEI
ncbi:MAG: hypothetical protein Q9204_001598 [Flavoplaca sp. TL-2023a]